MQKIKTTVTLIFLILFFNSDFCLGALPAPISEWKFNGDGSNEVFSMPAATAVGSPVFETTGGIDGGYVHIPANTDWLSIPHISSYNLPTSFTVEFWFRQFLNQSFTQRLIFKGEENCNFQIYRSLWNVYNNGPVKAAYKGVDGLWHHVTNLNGLTHGRWHHVVYTKDAAEHAYYLNGALIYKTGSTVNAEINSDTIIVGDTAVNTDFDELRIYNQALTASEVASRYNRYAISFFSNFEDSNGGFSSTGDWQWGAYSWAGTCTYQAPPASAHTGENMWGTILNGCYNNLSNNSGFDTCINTNTADDSVLSFTASLAGMRNATLSWWEWNDVFSPWDWTEVYVNGDVVFQNCSGAFTEPFEWEYRVVDLTPYAGQTITVRFHMMASSVIERSGWYLDDVMVHGKTSQAVMAPIYLLLD